MATRLRRNCDPLRILQISIIHYQLVNLTISLCLVVSFFLPVVQTHRPWKYGKELYGLQNTSNLCTTAQPLELQAPKCNLHK